MDGTFPPILAYKLQNSVSKNGIEWDLINEQSWLVIEGDRRVMGQADGSREIRFARRVQPVSRNTPEHPLTPCKQAIAR